MGYATQEIAVKNQKQLNVVLKEDTKVLDEVIVIGYGTTTRKSAVGAVDQVKASMIEDRPVANMTDALQGLRPTWLSSSAVAILMIVRLTLISVVSAL